MDKRAPANSANVLEGVLELLLETGTEGGYWAFQDKKHITKNTTIFTCKKCHCYWDKTRDPNGPSANLSDDKNSHLCEKDKHELILVCSEDWDYEKGLYILKNEDHLTIYSKRDSKKISWSGKISLKQHSSFTKHIFGLWIHADQKGVNKKTWANYFLKHCPTKLVPFKKTTT